MDIGIIDYGMGNIGSIFNMIKKKATHQKLLQIIKTFLITQN